MQLPMPHRTPTFSFVKLNRLISLSILPNAARQVSGDKALLISSTKRCIYVPRTKTLPRSPHNLRIGKTVREIGELIDIECPAAV